VSWPIIDEVIEATIKPFTDNIYKGFGGKSWACIIIIRSLSVFAPKAQRCGLDGKTAIKDLMLYQILRERSLPAI